MHGHNIGQLGKFTQYESIDTLIQYRSIRYNYTILTDQLETSTQYSLNS